MNLSLYKYNSSGKKQNMCFVPFRVENWVTNGKRRKEFLLNTFSYLLNFELYIYVIYAKINELMKLPNIV